MISTGTTTASGGRNRVDSTKNSQSFVPGIRNREKPYAQSVARQTAASVDRSPMTTLFPR